MCIQLTRDLYSVVLTRQSNPPISKFSSPFTSVWLMFPYNTHKQKDVNALNNDNQNLKYILLQEQSELAMGTFKYIGRFRSARMIGKNLADFYM